MTESHTSAPLELSQESRAFIDDFATAFSAMNAGRMVGRVLGLMLIVDEPYLSSEQIVQALGASAGSVSTATRELQTVGFIKRHTVSGDRRHYFRVEDDAWGAFLAGERVYLRRMSAAFKTGLSELPDEAESPRKRLRNAARYMDWLEGYHRQILNDWEAYRDREGND